MSKTIMDTNPLPPLDRDPGSTSDSHRDPQSDLPRSDADSDSPPAANPTSNLAPISSSRSLPTPRESALSPFSEIFLGPDGLYPGARWLIYLAMAFVTVGLLNFLLSGLQPEPTPLWWTMVTEARLMVAAILPAFLMARIEGRSFGDFGLPAKAGFGRDFWAGAFWGFASLTVLMLVLAAVRAYSFGSFSLHGARIFKFAFYYAIFFLITALFEDFLMRGYSQWLLAQGMGFWPAAALLSLVFGAMHWGNPGEAKIGLAAVVAIGFFFCLTLRRTGTLWFAIGFHMAWDWAESFFYSVPDSGTVVHGHLLNSTFHGSDWLTGGSVGPEGSYLLFILIAALWLVFSRAYPEVKYHT
jgi:uncharacterized protein